MTDKLPNARCSALPRITSCTASAERPEIIIDSSGGVAGVGTAAHEFYARMVMVRLDEPGDLFGLAATHGVDEDELRMLAWSGLREWRKVRDRIDVWDVEGEMVHVVTDAENKPMFRLTGHRDLGGRVKSDPTTGVIIDWKAGYKENGYLPQTKGYALLDLLVYGNPNLPRFREDRGFVIPEKYLLLVVWTRLGVTETFAASAADLMKFKNELCRIFASETKRYSPSDENCTYCPLSLDCPARRALMESAGRDIQAMAGEGIGSEITPAKLAALYPQSRVLKKALENYESMLKASVEQAGGSIGFEGGEIGLRESTYRKIGWNPDVLRRFLSEEQIAELRPTIGKTELDKAVSDGAPRGQKGTAKEECLLALKEAGSVEEKQVKSIEYRKVS